MLLGFVHHCSRLALWEIVNCCTYRIYAPVYHCRVWWYRLCKSLTYFHQASIDIYRAKRKARDKEMIFFVINFDCCCAVLLLLNKKKNIHSHRYSSNFEDELCVQLKAGKFFISQCCWRSFREALEKKSNEVDLKLKFRTWFVI